VRSVYVVHFRAVASEREFLLTNQVDEVKQQTMAVCIFALVIAKHSCRTTSNGPKTHSVACLERSCRVFQDSLFGTLDGLLSELIRDFCLLGPHTGSSTPVQYLLFSRGWAVRVLSAIGLHGNSALLNMGPGAWGLGPVPTLLTGLYAAAAARHVRKH
jgi:hypothetical protein